MSVTVKFAFTEAGSKRLEEFYRAHTVGEMVRLQIGSFSHQFKLDERKSFDRQEFVGLFQQADKALEAGLREKQ